MIKIRHCNCTAGTFGRNTVGPLSDSLLRPIKSIPCIRLLPRLPLILAGWRWFQVSNDILWHQQPVSTLRTSTLCRTSRSTLGTRLALPFVSVGSTHLDPPTRPPPPSLQHHNAYNEQHRYVAAPGGANLARYQVQLLLQCLLHLLHFSTTVAALLAHLMASNFNIDLMCMAFCTLAYTTMARSSHQ